MAATVKISLRVIVLVPSPCVAIQVVKDIVNQGAIGLDLTTPENVQVTIDYSGSMSKSNCWYLPKMAYCQVSSPKMGNQGK